MEKISLIVGTHNHLPIGRSPDAAEKAYQDAFKALLTVAYCYPDFPVTLHYSGVLMDWLEETHPEFLTLLGEMVRRGQVEVLGGGYYDPILPMIPTSDKLGQLEKMTTWLRIRFETRPRGCWIAEKVWEPSLASVLRASGMDYTFLDEGQFRIAGVPEGKLFRPYIAEDQGKFISVFPVSDILADLASRAKPSDAIAFLKDLPDSGSSPVAVLLDDGEAAPAHLLRQGWLEEFIRLAGENRDWLGATTPAHYLREHPPAERAYIPSCSSVAMMGWALPPERRAIYQEARRRCGEAGDGGQFAVGGHFRQFLTRYPESWLMYAKMINTHVLVSQVRGDKYKKKAAQNELWRGQCHTAYWHAAGGGIFENGLRKAVYRALIEAEKIARATEIFAPSIIGVDYDMDNRTEFLYQGSELNAYIHATGGSLFELDFLPASWNYLDTMDQRDAGHEGYSRKAFLDHFLEPECSIEEFAWGTGTEAGDFLTGPYELVELNRSLPELLLRRQGIVSTSGARRPVRIEKRFVFRPRSIDVYYAVANLGDGDLVSRFGVEMNVSLISRAADSSRIFLLDEDRKSEIETSRVEREGVRGLLVYDVRNEVSITISSARAFRFWSLPVETLLPGAPEREPLFQSHCFVPHWDLRVAPGETWENHLSVGFEKTQSAERVEGN